VFLYSIEKFNTNRVHSFYFVHVEFLQLDEGTYSAADSGLKFNMAKPSDDFIKVSELHKIFEMSWETFERHGN
jgi:hypothetical protein